MRIKWGNVHCFHNARDAIFDLPSFRREVRPGFMTCGRAMTGIGLEREAIHIQVQHITTHDGRRLALVLQVVALRAISLTTFKTMSPMLVAVVGSLSWYR